MGKAKKLQRQATRSAEMAIRGMGPRPRPFVPSSANLDFVRNVQGSEAEVHQKFMQQFLEERLRGRSRIFRNIPGDSLFGTVARFSQISARSSYQRRRGR